MNPDLELYMILFAMGGLAVLVGTWLKKWIFLPAWLCGWAIGLTIMASAAMDEIGSFAIQIGVAMVVGVVYVGIGVDLFQSALIRMITGEKRKKGAD